MKLSRLPFARYCVAGFLLYTAMLGDGSRAAAVTRFVSNFNNSGAGSLRGALNDAVNGDTIDLAVTGAITLTSGQLEVSDNLTITGPGAASLTVRRSTTSGTPEFRIFAINPGIAVTLTGISINNGKVTGSAGSGIYNAGTLTVNNCVIAANASLDGPSGSNIYSSGGGIYNSVGTLTANDTTFSANRATNGGGIYNDRGTVTLNRCTFDSNFGGSGGGLDTYGGAVTIEDCVFTNNGGGGIYGPDSKAPTSLKK